MGTQEHDGAGRASLAAALQPVFSQLVRALEAHDPSALLDKNGALSAALTGWQKTVATQTSGVARKRARELEDAKLQIMARAAQLEKERNDLALRNKEILTELVRAKKAQDADRQHLLEAKFASSGHQSNAKRLDLEVRELRRRVRELEGGPPLSAAEAAPKSRPAKKAPPPPSAKIAAAELEPAPSRRAAAEAAFRALMGAPPASKKAAPKKRPVKKKTTPKKTAPKKTAPKKRPARRRART